MIANWDIPNVTNMVEGKIPEVLNLVGEFVKGEAQLNCVVKTGNLKNSINHKVIGNDRVRIGTPVGYAIHVEHGTRPHTIFPKNAKALRFKIGNRIVFAKSVNHPGTQAHPFLRPALWNNQQKILNFFKGAMK